MIRRLLEALKLIKPLNPHLPQANVSGSAVNPYKLVWYNADWSKTKTEKNNAKYWEWEIMYNGFKCP